MQFQPQLANETWDPVYTDNGTNKFNSFLHTFLNIFEGSFFLVKYRSIHRNKNGWITQEIKISCVHKGDYTYSRDRNDAVMKAFYIKYHKILNIVIQEAKKQHYNRHS
jgi:hypothetical protein